MLLRRQGATVECVVRHRFPRILGVAGLLLVLGLAAWLGRMWWDSRLPGTYSAMDMGEPDYGGGSVVAGHGDHASHAGMTSVATLTGPTGPPDERFMLTARTADVRLPSGRTVDALTFNGTVPGPELRVREGDVVEVTLVNRDVDSGVSIHWHGVDVPNAEDGVAGVTQDAVHPGGRHVYRFRPDRAGTFWYHTHQVSSEEVRRGLFGALVVEPRALEPGASLDLALASHDVAGTTTLGGSDRLEQRRVDSGTPVRLRLINTDNTPRGYTIDGTPFRVLAIDGNDVHEPTLLDHRTLEVAAGGRYDVGFTMPAGSVRLSVADTQAGLLLSDSTADDAAPAPPGPEFDPIDYGAPAAQPFGADSRFDRSFRFSIGRKPGFFDGRPGMQWTINGGIFPDVPMYVVRRGDLVKVTIENHTEAVHPMHLHGHRMLVLDRDGVRPSGSPWWTDTLDVDPGQRYNVAFLADNPGIWMDHCHNLRHAADGLVMHVMYEGVTTPYVVGGTAHNHPE
jgi:FtsP/CotA-like multicopper oxidase with cupredoxin domain